MNSCCYYSHYVIRNSRGTVHVNQSILANKKRLSNPLTSNKLVAMICKVDMAHALITFLSHGDLHLFRHHTFSSPAGVTVLR